MFNKLTLTPVILLTFIFFLQNPFLLMAAYVLLCAFFFFKKNVFNYKIFQNLILVNVIYLLIVFINLLCYEESSFVFINKIRFFSKIPMITSSFVVDKLSLSFGLVILTISFFVLIFQNNYTKGFLTKERFFIQLNFFIISMLFLVFSGNWIFLLFCWECLGLSSFFLITFFKQRTGVFKSGFKAFCFNRLSDLLMMLSCIFYYKTTNSLCLHSNFFFFKNLVFNKVYFNLFFAFIVTASLLKSAQFCFFFWLPDSMEAPIPASALIHSATLVSAGVYLCLRFKFFFYYSQTIPTLLMYSSLFGMVFFSRISSTQSDVKKLLAFSTISNCSFIYFLISIKEYSLSLFFFTIHGFFKSLCFLLVGFIILSNNHKQDFKNWNIVFSKFNLILNLLLIHTVNLSALPISLTYSLKAKINLICFSNVYLFYLFLVCFLLYTVFSYLYGVRLFSFFSSKKSNSLKSNYVNESDYSNILNVCFIYFLFIFSYFYSSVLLLYPIVSFNVFVITNLFYLTLLAGYFYFRKKTNDFFLINVFFFTVLFFLF